jgi:NAD(P)-dependent dehydrogenase (short-subunit alcohol dehydrogenase family)
MTASHRFPDVVCVVGAGRGIGRAVALACAKLTRSVLCVSRSDTCVKTRDDIIALGGTAAALQLDIGDHAATYRALSKWAAEVSGSRIGLVAAAAILGPQGPLSAEHLADWERTFRVNLIGILASVEALLPAMIGVRYGRIITFAGGGSTYAYPIFPAYSASKSALVRAVENLAEDVKDRGDIATVCLAPGAIETDLLASVKAAGGEVRTKSDISLVISFIEAFMTGHATAISGRLVHVKDDYREILRGNAATLSNDHWKLRRAE